MDAIDSVGVISSSVSVIFRPPESAEHPTRRVIESVASKVRRGTVIMAGIERYASGFSKSNQIDVRSFHGRLGE